MPHWSSINIYTLPSAGKLSIVCWHTCTKRPTESQSRSPTVTQSITTRGMLQGLQGCFFPLVATPYECFHASLSALATNPVPPAIASVYFILFFHQDIISSLSGCFLFLFYFLFFFNASFFVGRNMKRAICALKTSYHDDTADPLLDWRLQDNVWCSGEIIT